MQTDNLELKKLVYLYLMNYAKSQPDMAIMAVNSFVKASPSLFRAPELMLGNCCKGSSNEQESIVLGNKSYVNNL